MKEQAFQKYSIHKLSLEQNQILNDSVAIEKPLQLFLADEIQKISLTMTMRSPGNEWEWAIGFLLSEGMIKTYTDVISFQFNPGECDEIIVNVASHIIKNIHAQRSFAINSACGVCGKNSFGDVYLPEKTEQSGGIDIQIKRSILMQLAKKNFSQQPLFAETGGVHAATLVNFEGKPIFTFEDIGRHNAVDKLIGRAFLDQNYPIFDKVLFLSGRAGFELIQKSVVAQIPIICSIGAPSSLAIDLARQYQITLCGFLGEQRMNIYSNPERVI